MNVDARFIHNPNDFHQAYTYPGMGGHDDRDREQVSAANGPTNTGAVLPPSLASDAGVRSNSVGFPDFVPTGEAGAAVNNGGSANNSKSNLLAGTGSGGQAGLLSASNVRQTGGGPPQNMMGIAGTPWLPQDAALYSYDPFPHDLSGRRTPTALGQFVPNPQFHMGAPPFFGYGDAVLGGPLNIPLGMASLMPQNATPQPNNPTPQPSATSPAVPINNAFISMQGAVGVGNSASNPVTAQLPHSVTPSQQPPNSGAVTPQPNDRSGVMVMGDTPTSGDGVKMVGSGGMHPPNQNYYFASGSANHGGSYRQTLNPSIYNSYRMNSANANTRSPQTLPTGQKSNSSAPAVKVIETYYKVPSSGGQNRNQRKQDRFDKTALYKTELCTNWMLTGSCTYGNKCHFAHGVEDLKPRMRVENYKTQPCCDPAREGCRRCMYGRRCNYCHPGEAIRRPHPTPYYDKDYYEALRRDFGPDNEFPFGIYI